MARADQIFHVREAIEKQLGFAQSVRAGPTLYMSGLISIDKVGSVLNPDDMAAQIKNVYGELKSILVFHGLSFEDVVKEVVYTTDIAALMANASVRLDFFKGYAPPAATWVEVRKLAFPGILIEVELTLYVP